MVLLEGLRPKVRRLARTLVSHCNDAHIPIEIVRGYRSIKTQDGYYAQGRTQTGPIITFAHGGRSFHNYGLAFDVHALHFKTESETAEILKRIGSIGEQLGLEWGGHWDDFVDMPHFQYTGGYHIDDLQNGSVDWSVFE